MMFLSLSMIAGKDTQFGHCQGYVDDRGKSLVKCAGVLAQNL